jgi:alpha-glucosidase
MHQSFNFPYLSSDWDAAELRTVIDESIAAFGAVGAPSTWVLSNHDVIRHATRLSLDEGTPQGHGIGPNTPDLPEEGAGLGRARAATTLMLALPGSAYVYQGEELGLPEAIDIPDEARQDPTWFRTNGERYGRDGCRVPLPWTSSGASHGFSETGESWLPQPASWASYAREAQEGVEGSTLELYRSLLALRKQHGLGTGSLSWLPSEEGVLALRNGDVTVIANVSAEPVALPSGTVLASSGPLTDGKLAADTTVWIG